MQNFRMTTKEWQEYIQKGRNKTSRKIANNTTARIIPEGVAIRLHDTDVAVFLNGTDRVILNSGGWRTVTTKDRLNTYTNAGISQRAGVWYMSDGSLFYDGMTINGDGTPRSPRRTDK